MSWSDLNTGDLNDLNTGDLNDLNTGDLNDLNTGDLNTGNASPSVDLEMEIGKNQHRFFRVISQ